MPVQSILIVDDEANQRLILERALESPENWSIVTAASGCEALRLAYERPPDLIITDYNMLAMNGLELIAHLRDAGFSARIILMTAYTSQEIKEAAERLCVDHYLAKPVSLRLLRVITAVAMERRTPAE